MESKSLKACRWPLANAILATPMTHLPITKYYSQMVGFWTALISMSVRIPRKMNVLKIKIVSIRLGHTNVFVKKILCWTVLRQTAFRQWLQRLPELQRRRHLQMRRYLWHRQQQRALHHWWQQRNLLQRMQLRILQQQVFKQMKIFWNHLMKSFEIFFFQRQTKHFIVLVLLLTTKMKNATVLSIGG